ncbi:MAG: hypothetical protein IT384_13460 [Deltaproteobacteria bacterium]|nr:hypothetical protein [Deltaproteobacteria bacterium]
MVDKLRGRDGQKLLGAHKTRRARVGLGAKKRPKATQGSAVEKIRGRPDQAPIEAPASPLLDPFQLPLDAATGAAAALTVGRWNRAGARLVVTNNTVEALLTGGDLQSLQPKVPPELEWILRRMLVALGKEGALGAVGPLSRLGAAGDAPRNPGHWLSSTDWRAWSVLLTSIGGPMSEAGALGGGGPLAERSREALRRLLPGVTAQLDLGGVLEVIGPFGPLGPLFILGLLGQVGGHGFRQNAEGEFVDPEGKIVRTTDVVHLGERRTLELVEFYGEAFAEVFGANDTSWMVRGAIEPSEPNGDHFAFTSRDDQLVTLLLVPDRIDDNFSLEVLVDGKRVAESRPGKVVPFVTLTAAEAERLEVRVRLEKADPPGTLRPIADYVESALRPTTHLLGSRENREPPDPPPVALTKALTASATAWTEMNAAFWAATFQLLRIPSASDAPDQREAVLTRAALAPFKAWFDLVNAGVEALGFKHQDLRPAHGYRLLSVGSTKYAGDITVSGDHQRWVP